ncbi:MAG: hypothetical protein R3F46_03005 [bacterium]
MTLDRSWVEERLQRIERKREMLALLRDSLSDWERELSAPDIPEAKRESIQRLADSSIDTLESLISRLNDEVREGLAEIVAMKLRDGR